MASILSGPGLRFLYRTEEGVIDRQAWWLGLAPLASVLFVLTLVWLALKPYAGRGLDERAFLDPLTLAASIFLVIYAFALILIVVCFVMLSMKRLRDRGRATPLAGALPLAALLASAAHWLQPQMEGALPGWGVAILDLVLLVTLVWTVVEMGLLRGK